jgi:hypothetical protein
VRFGCQCGLDPQSSPAPEQPRAWMPPDQVRGKLRQARHDNGGGCVLVCHCGLDPQSSPVPERPRAWMPGQARHDTGGTRALVCHCGLDPQSSPAPEQPRAWMPGQARHDSRGRCVSDWMPPDQVRGKLRQARHDTPKHWPTAAGHACSAAHISWSRWAVQMRGCLMPRASSNARVTSNGRQCS